MEVKDKWEDTVMNYELKLCHSLIGKYSLFAIKDVVDEECLAQAEITWLIAEKVGYDEGLKVGILDAEELDAGMLRAEQKAGMKKVVEWASQDCDCGMNLLASHWQCSKCRQAKLKEWGL